MEAYLNSDKLKSYLGEYCREERQFAVFLYDYLKNHTDLQDEVVKCCLNLEDGIEGKIKAVYFEADLMRDYFAQEKNKKEFNRKLLHFCLGWMEKDDERVENWLKKLELKQEVQKGNHNSSYHLGQAEAKKESGKIPSQHKKYQHY